MEEIRQYVDKLFKKYGNAKQIKELKAEIISNMEAQKEDLIKQGIDEVTAIKMATESISSIDELVEDKVGVKYYSYKIHKIQITLIVFLIGWIFSIPGIVLGRIGMMSFYFLAAIIGIGIYYIIILVIARKDKNETVHFISTTKLLRYAKWSWIIFAIFMIICSVATTGILFASNIWFSRPIRINGPYQLAIIISQYLAPFFAMVIPIIFTATRLTWKKYEV